jgi:hypothetical protein
MNNAAVILLTAFALFAFASCRECTECLKYPSPDIKLCKKDFASDDSYTAAYRQVVADGYDCD